ILLFLLTFSTMTSTQQLPKNTLKEAMFYKTIHTNKIQCELCFRRCIIDEDKRGFCRIRENQNGKLYSLVYGKPVGLQIDPIELEPMYHLIPGHKNLCVYTASCNFRCKHCHNWHITQRTFEELPHKSYTPQEVVNQAIKAGCKSISHSINEPTVFYEYMLDIAKIAKQKGLKVLFHTNGSINPEPLKEILKYVDAVTVDLKGFNKKFYSEIPEADLEHILQILKIIRQQKKHLEIVNLIIPTLNDNLDDIKNMCLWIKDNLGEDVPLHFTRFSPSYKLTHLPFTPIETLQKAREIAISLGLKYVYIGNVAGHEGNNTYCPNCKKLLIKRIHYVVVENKIGTSGKCKFCKTEIVGIWQ
ncbi:MAG: AmmeMemoRadiSam system radical SAM enzyme, partial [Elusimicrobiota bacterium]|nr:AmmeMemoRadiSam system radical SAM enzyme [Elusimicrobiota bacterium]